MAKAPKTAAAEKKPSKKAAAPKAEKPAAAAAPPPPKNGDNGGSELTAKENRGLAFHHFQKVKAQSDVVEAEQKHLADLFKVAKEDGIAKKDLAFMLKCADLDKRAGQVERIAREAEIASWFALPIFYQPDMFEQKREPINERAKREGYAAGYEGKNPSPPFDIDSKPGQLWMEQWHAAQADRRAEFAAAMEKKIAQRRLKAEPDDEPFGDDEDGGEGIEPGASSEGEVGATLQ